MTQRQVLRSRHGNLPIGSALYWPGSDRSRAMADNGGVGVLGVLVGALLVILVGGGILLATGQLGSGSKTSTTLKIETPKITTGSGASK